MKKILCSIASLLIITGCTSTTSLDKEEERYKTSSYVNKLTDISATNFIRVELDHAYTPEFMKENADTIILGTVLSLDEASMEYNSAVGYTYGKLLVQTSLFGNLKSGEQISYAKPGCVIAAKSFEMAQSQESKDKKAYLRTKNGESQEAVGTYDMLIENDIHIEEGKSYLIYLKYSNSMEKYEVIGLGNGLRELNVSKSDVVRKASFQMDELTILNNDTGVQENLQEYIDAYIK